ncbi:membrane protein [Acrocarpospora phusangensis]|uniref:Membrane protein n=1 Tax=Acrocarpospora phusangensis TaxID=1070424 RepID=A0A919Q8H0_9ACTN|nr:PH domain-containing protein [Acrocarpospora phusangensis]GIH23139.1 membrane protein [Acrocarpospora phusangensis]
MPEALPALPLTWRPRRSRFVAYGLAALMLVGSLILAIILPEQFKAPDRIGMVAFFGAIAWVLHLLGRIRVVAEENGLTVVNVLRTHHYEWPEVLDVTLADADPWPRLDLADGTVIGAMGIQGSEKIRAAKAVAELRILVKAKGEAPEA